MSPSNKYLLFFCFLILSVDFRAQTSKIRNLLIGKWVYEKLTASCGGTTTANREQKGKIIIEFNQDSTFLYSYEASDTTYRSMGKWSVKKQEIVFSGYSDPKALIVNVFLPFKIISVSKEKLIVKTQLVVERCVYPKPRCFYRDHYVRINT